MYFPTLSPASGMLKALSWYHLIRNFRLNRPHHMMSIGWRRWLNREGEQFGTGVRISDRNTLELSW